MLPEKNRVHVGYCAPHGYGERAHENKLKRSRMRASARRLQPETQATDTPQAMNADTGAASAPKGTWARVARRWSQFGPSLFVYSTAWGEQTCFLPFSVIWALYEGVLEERQTLAWLTTALNDAGRPQHDAAAPSRRRSAGESWSVRWDQFTRMT